MRPPVYDNFLIANGVDMNRLGKGTLKSVGLDGNAVQGSVRAFNSLTVLYGFVIAHKHLLMVLYSHVKQLQHH